MLRTKSLALFILQKNKKERGFVLMRKKAKSITWKDRQRIELLLKVDLPVTQIAADIGVTRGAIYQEITRGGQPYSADLAQKNVGA